MREICKQPKGTAVNQNEQMRDVHIPVHIIDIQLIITVFSISSAIVNSPADIMFNLLYFPVLT